MFFEGSANKKVNFCVFAVLMCAPGHSISIDVNVDIDSTWANHQEQARQCRRCANVKELK